MLKNILITVLSILCTLLFFYSFLKADEAQKAMLEAQAQRNEAIILQKEADKLKEDALMSAAEAKRMESEAMRLREELNNCK